jgi:hypothetical protein
VEAWVALATALLLALGAPVAGWAGGARIDSSLQQTVRLQHEQRHRTTAVVTGLPTERQRDAFDAESAIGRNGGSQVIAKWKAVDGSPHTGTIIAPGHQVRPGFSFSIWADQHGRQVRSPMNGTLATVHAALAGFALAVLAAGLVEFLRRLIVWRLVLRRYSRLDGAWAKAGPDWGRTGAGS